MRQIADSIKRFGFTNPVLISEAGEIIAGHGRVMAAALLGMTGKHATLASTGERFEVRRECNDAISTEASA